MKPGAVFHNIGRGTTVDQAALLARCVPDTSPPPGWMSPSPNRCPPTIRCGTSRTVSSPRTSPGATRDESGTLVRHFLANLKRYLKARR